ncbi:hypothetical protein GC163_12220 [bacterium]|nr:hypothetical protein [bacterium]
MGWGFLALATIGSYLAARRSLGYGIVAVMAVGYVNGYIRANYLGVATTLMFDGALGGLYVAQLQSLLRPGPIERPGLRKWVTALILWPTVLLAIPINDPLIQLVGWRGDVWAIPMILLGTRLKREDFATMAVGISLLNCMALMAGIYVYFNGLGSLFPRNSVTELMYRSTDIAGGHARIPALFLNAHQYGGTMVQCLPFLFGGLLQPSVSFLRTLLMIVGVTTAFAGILMCGARQPVVILVLVGIIAWYCSGLSLKMLLIAVSLLCAATGVAMTNPRLQRFMQLQSTDYVANRIHGSNNEHVLDIMLGLPLGAGLGAGAPSIPFFLQDRAPDAPAAENEYARITINQGWVGLGIWLSFLFWLLSYAFPRHEPSFQHWMRILAYSLVFVGWASAILGTGALVAIPMSCMMLLQIGMISQLPLKSTHRRHQESHADEELPTIHGRHSTGQPALIGL